MRIGKFIITRVTALFIIGTLSLLVFLICLQAYTSRFIFQDKFDIPSKYRVGVVYGAKLNPDGTPGTYLKDRLDTALDLYYSDKINIIILSGERLNHNFNEIDVMEQYILDNGVPIENTYIDAGGLDTYSTVYRVKNIFQFDKVIYITQNFHLTRATFLGKMMGVDCIGYNADRSKYKNLNEHKFREVFANIKAVLDFSKDRQPDVLVDSKDSIN
ncbi:SanA/YdcF family protein [Faecalibacter bovis]|uniref:YdcF family protein n=1 Tax=Faecalibacter bovis TaxID=2898187 RepID=A0ABX7XD32_9FLAO|nr:ElyC/SanA/YdcF family protein [Faecalibacter bovis]QTV05780.1 YdcF family protein [Faecalibacter bovis]